MSTGWLLIGEPETAHETFIRMRIGEQRLACKAESTSFLRGVAMRVNRDVMYLVCFVQSVLPG